MPYSVEWYIENEIVFANYSGELSPDELRTSLLEIQDYIERSPRPLVHVISDVGDVTIPTPPKESLEVVREVGSHPRAGWNIILREKSLLVKLGVALGTSVFKIRNRTFDTIDKAQEFLHEMDDTLSWDKVNKSIVLQ